MDAKQCVQMTRENEMTEFIQLVKDIGPAMGIVLVIVLLLYDRSKAETKTENTVSDIAGSSTRELSEMRKEVGDIRQQLGMAQGQNIILMDNLKTLGQKHEAAETVTKDKIYVLQEKVEKQTITISRHEGRIIELEKESKQKDEIISSKEHEIVELKIESARQKVIIETQETKIAQQERSLQLVTRAQSLDDTIQLTEAELLDLADPVPTEPIAASTPETNEEERKIA